MPRIDPTGLNLEERVVKINRVANIGPDVQDRVEIGKSTPPRGQLSLL